jgi:hypothetical protein
MLLIELALAAWARAAKADTRIRADANRAVTVGE